MVRREQRATYCSGEYLQPPEAHVRRHVGREVENQQRDCDEAEVDEEGENVEQEEPLEEEEVGEDAAAEPAAYLLHGALPQLQGLPGRAQTVAEPAERLRERRRLSQKAWLAVGMWFGDGVAHSPATHSRSSQQNMRTCETLWMPALDSYWKEIEYERQRLKKKKKIKICS